VEFNEFQQQTEECLDTLATDPLTFTPKILSTVNAVVDKKFQNLSTLVNQATKFHLSSTSSAIQSILHQPHP
jgi:hypothetical protein